MWAGRSTLLAIQLFSTKSRTSIPAGNLLFYLLHITVLTFIEGRRREQIKKNRKVLAYLPVRYEDDGVHGLSNKTNSVPS